MFKDRIDAGCQLAQRLIRVRNKRNVVILAIPRGGVPVAYAMDKFLYLPFDLLVIRKLPMPGDPEAGLGAISETGETVFQPQAKIYSPKIIQEIISKQLVEIKRRIHALRGDRKLINIKGKTVILVDDGLAMGSTMEAAVKTVRKLGVKKIIVAVPVGSKEAVNIIKSEVHELVCLDIPSLFYAVAQDYKHWHDVSDKEVKDILFKIKKYVPVSQKNLS